MARGRLISRSLGSSRKFHELMTVGGKLGEFCQVLFPLVIANTDDFGRMPGDAFTIKNLVLPSSKRPEADFEKALAVMDQITLITRYVVNGAIYLQVNKFDEHQINLTKRTVSKFPEVPEGGRKVPSNIRESNLTESNLIESNPEPRAERAEVSPFDAFWAVYPKKKAKDKARKAWDKRHPDAELLAVILRALERQKASPDWQKEQGRYIPHPATWLNDGRWTDSLEPSELDSLSDTLRFNLAASDEAERLILEHDAARKTGTHGHRG